MHVHTQALHTALNAGALPTELMQHKELEEDELACVPWGLFLPAPICLAQLAVKLNSVIELCPPPSPG